MYECFLLYQYMHPDLYFLFMWIINETKFTVPVHRGTLLLTQTKTSVAPFRMVSSRRTFIHTTTIKPYNETTVFFS